MSLFKLGTIVMTPGIKDMIDRDPSNMTFFQNCVKRHSEGDWGYLDEEDRKINDAALEAERTGEGEMDSLMSVYRKDGSEYWIITEWDRSVTTILLPCEY